jgi:hypothetical protein
MKLLSKLHPRTRRIVLIFFFVYVFGPALPILLILGAFQQDGSPFHFESLNENLTLTEIRMVYVEEIEDPSTFKVYRYLDDVNLVYLAGELANTDYYYIMGHSTPHGYCFYLLYSNNSSMFFCDQGIANRDQDGTITMTHSVRSVNNNFELLWEKYYGFPMDMLEPNDYDASIPEY